MEEKIQAFREAFLELPEERRHSEVLRLYSIIRGKPFIVLEDSDRGKVLKFLSIPDLMEYLFREKAIKADRSFLYKVLRGQHQYAYGYKIYYEEIE